MASRPALDHEQLCQDIVVIAAQAGAVIMEIFHSPFEVRTKADKSPVTVADERAEALIVERLAPLAPGIPVVGEEAYAAGQRPDVSGGLFWLVDALDGTSEFTRHGEDFTVNIALVEDGVPILGTVHAPALGLTYWGAPDGAFRMIGDAGAERIAARAPAPDGMVAVISKSHQTDEKSFLSDYPIKKIVNRGSSLKFCLVASGDADIYPRLGTTAEWDIAAGHAVLSAAGGTVTTLDGASLFYGKSDIRNPHFVARGRPS